MLRWDKHPTYQEYECRRPTVALLRQSRPCNRLLLLLATVSWSACNFCFELLCRTELTVSVVINPPDCRKGNAIKSRLKSSLKRWISQRQRTGKKFELLRVTFIISIRQLIPNIDCKTHQPMRHLIELDCFGKQKMKQGEFRSCCGKPLRKKG